MMVDYRLRSAKFIRDIMAEQLNIILVPHTHWDREWYQTFQQFRMRLVHAIDRLLDILDRDAKFTYFMLDGQTIVLEDYLEVRPEEEERLKKHTRSGRILVGPWYLQPDEYLVSGESLVRNLQIGLRQAAEYGEPMRVGYVPDCFGHIAQLPQILRGFGIDNAVFWRGVGAEVKKSEFYWAASDGTQILVVYLADTLGYSNARDMPLNAEEFVIRTKFMIAPLLPRATTNTLLFMNGSDHLEPQDGLPEAIEAANQLLANITPEQEKVLARYGYLEQNGQVNHFDRIHVRIGTLPQYIEAVRQQIERSPGTPLQMLSGEMRDSQYAHLLPAVLSTRMWIKQQNTATEHLLERWVEPLTAWAWKLGAPYPKGLVKLAWKYLLQNHPHDSICGCSIDQVHRENSIRFVQSQQISENLITEVMQQLASFTDTRAPTHAHINGPGTDHEALPIIVFNPAPGPRTEAVQFVAQLPGSLKNAVLVDERGTHMPYHVVHSSRHEIGSMSLAREMASAAVALQGVQAPGDLISMAQAMIANGPGQYQNTYLITSVHIEEGQQAGVASIELLVTQRGRVNVNMQELLAAERHILALLQREDITTLEFTVIGDPRQTIDFIAADLPAYGLKTYWMYPYGLQDEGQLAPAGLAAGQEEGETSKHRYIENEFYGVEVNLEDGTLAVTDKQTGAVFTGLNRFVDGGDVGDLYTYCPPVHDTLISKPLEPPKIELLSPGPIHSILRISGRWSLPSACSPTRAERGTEMTVCQIESDVSLTAGVHRIDIHTRVENIVKDHRLRVTFSVPCTVERVAAEGTFEVRSRPLAALRPADVTEWLEEPVNTFPQKRFVNVSNGKVGLGVLNRGLPEYEIVQDEAGQMAVAVTLLRCVEWLSRGDLSTRQGHAGPMEFTPEAQCLGHHEFDYALVPHSGDWEAEEALVLREAHAFNTPVRVLTSQQHEGQLPSRATLVEVEPRTLVVSAIKQSETGQGLIVRVYNPLSQAVEASLRPGFACSRAFVTNLQEEIEAGKGEAGHPQGVPLHIGLRAGEIMTVLFE
jgi:mannosylglycerate hydrolase